MKIQSPCFGCDKRYVGCHSVCDEYAMYKKRVDEQKERIENEKAIQRYIAGKRWQ